MSQNQVIKKQSSEIIEMAQLWNKADCFICDLGELISKRPFSEKRTLEVIANMIKSYKRGEL